MSVRAVLAAAFAATLACAALAATASASFGPIDLQSVGPFDQFESAYEPAISADGRHLAFEGTLDGVKGIFRKDLQSGQVQLVAGASTYGSGSGALDASAPSISANGRYVSFTTTVGLVATANAGSNVYVRDMSLPLPSTANGACESSEEAAGRCAYALASARNGSAPNGGDQGLIYGAGQGNAGEGQGAVATGRVALSEDGREVVFVTLGVSDATAEKAGELTTPPLQVFVRYLDRHETVLVSAVRNAGTGAMTGAPVPEGAVTATTQFQASGEPLLPGAALSADGSTVAWLGAHIPSQAPTLADEAQKMSEDDNAQSRHYDEPLWRRIADGPTAPTRRIVGGGDPLAPGCAPGATLASSACRGPFPELTHETNGQESNLGWLSIAGYDGVPQLSADGRRVASIGDPGSTANVFVVDMHEGLDRLQAVRQLTREVPVALVTNPGSQLQYVASAGDVFDIGISPGGGRIAFTTQRELFPLAPPNFTEPPLSQLGVAELYQIDLGAESLQRVTHGPGNGPSLAGTVGGVTSHGAAAPSYSSDGRTIAFADTASNLLAGDANAASDAFTATDVQTSTVAGTVSIGAGPGPREPATPQWRLSVVAVTHPDGTATLDVVVPGAGRVAANVSATVPITTRAGAGGKGRAHGASRQRAKRAPRTALARRTVAAASMSVGVPGLLELPLRVTSSSTKLLSTTAGIYATVRVTFTGAGGPPLSQTVVLSLRRLEAKKRGTASGKSSNSKRKKAKPGGRSR
ncbi:MAG TPA: hypothetical protein VGI27_01360 [Solirubrobacteraceae bacterium]